jgi:hypothetical protein
MADPTQNEARKKKLQGVVDYIEEGEEMGHTNPLTRGGLVIPPEKERPDTFTAGPNPNYMTKYKPEKPTPDESQGVDQGIYQTPTAEAIAKSDPLGRSNKETELLRMQVDELAKQLGPKKDNQAIASQATELIKKIKEIDPRYQAVEFDHAWKRAYQERW